MKTRKLTDNQLFVLINTAILALDKGNFVGASNAIGLIPADQREYCKREIKAAMEIRLAKQK